MSEASGVIGWVGGKNYRGKMLYSFKFDGGDTFYSCGEVDPNVQQGDSVSFEFENKGRYNNVDMSTLVPHDTSKKPTGGNTIVNTSGDDRQYSIIYQSATNAAIQIVKLALANDALSLGPAKGDKLGVLISSVMNVAEEIVVDYAYAPARVRELMEEDSNPEKAETNIGEVSDE